MELRQLRVIDRVYYGYMNTKVGVLVSLGVVTITAAILYFMGRVFMSTSGALLLWVSDTNSAEMSQQISDWYTASHFIHGILFFGLLYFFRKWLSIGTRLVIATIIESGWEILENSSLIIDRYREATIAIGYTGDSILNSVSDIIFMIFGFFFTRYVPVWVAVLTVIILEVLVGYLIRDNLLLNIIMLIYPMDAIKVWQGG